jgi:hypothetical protein
VTVIRSVGAFISIVVECDERTGRGPVGGGSSAIGHRPNDTRSVGADRATSFRDRAAGASSICRAPGIVVRSSHPWRWVSRVVDNRWVRVDFPPHFKLNLGAFGTEVRVYALPDCAELLAGGGVPLVPTGRRR